MAVAALDAKVMRYHPRPKQVHLRTGMRLQSKVCCIILPSPHEEIATHPGRLDINLLIAYFVRIRYGGVSDFFPLPIFWMHDRGAGVAPPFANALFKRLPVIPGSSKHWGRRPNLVCLFQ